MPAAEGEGGIVIGHRHPIVGFQQPSVPGNPMIGSPTNRRPLIKRGMRTNAGAASLDNYWPKTQTFALGVDFSDNLWSHSCPEADELCPRYKTINWLGTFVDWWHLLREWVGSYSPPVRFIFGPRTFNSICFMWDEIWHQIWFGIFDFEPV